MRPDGFFLTGSHFPILFSIVILEAVRGDVHLSVLNVTKRKRNRKLFSAFLRPFCFLLALAVFIFSPSSSSFLFPPSVLPCL